MEQDRGSEGPAQHSTRLVAIGASAGGLEALQAFFSAVPSNSRSTFIVAQHLAPTHPSLMVDLLAPTTRLPVRLASDGDAIAPGSVFVVPPDRDVTLTRDSLTVSEVQERVAPRPSINRLFESAAEAWGSDVTAVVLSGTGSDGAEGLRAVREAGGVTMVQDPSTARFAGMPTVAMSLTTVDLIGAPAELGARADDLVASIESAGWEDSSPVAHDMVRSIVAQLHRQLDLDFSGYKEGTIRRQIQRRMAVMQVDSLDDYFAALTTMPDEAQNLADNLLVTVTEFFRDPEAFAALRAALADRLAARQEDDPIRVWVPGCATGEEVYSITMVIADLLGRPANLQRRLRVFGTDLDEASLTVARRAHYPLSAGDTIPVDLLDAFTVADADGFTVAEDIRGCTVFARHDVGEDPPFPSIDLVSCRNTLIYFAEPLQRRVLGLLAYAVRPHGLLLLGRAENLDDATTAFTPIDSQWRLFERTEEPAPRPNYPASSQPGRYTRPVGHSRRVPVSAPVTSQEHDDLLEALVRSSGRRFMVVDEMLDLVEVVGDVSPFCRVPEGRATTSAIALLEPQWADEARALLLLSRSEGRSVVGSELPGRGPDSSFRMSVAPLSVAGRDLHVVEFLAARTEPRDGVVRLERDVTSDEIIRHLEEQLRETQATLKRSMLELQETNEELESSSEELQAASEELKAANEELESSNEELTATNEELGALNQALRIRSEQLEELNDVLENIQDALNQGMVIVDHEASVVRFTPSAVRIFGLMDSDVGRPLADIPTTLPIPGLSDAIGAVLQGGERLSIEALGEPASYLIQVLPYHSVPGSRLGAIITLTDISEMAQLKSRLEANVVELERSQTLLQEQATYDNVTGLLNRGAFSAVVSRELARSHRASSSLALVWVDVDRFKDINDGYGHDAGDLVLRAFGERIVAATREADFVGRLGGDEFGVLVTDFHGDDELDSVADRMIEALHRPIEHGGQSIRVTGSMGIALYPVDGDTFDDLMRAADAAMYVAKRKGGDQVAYFDDSLNQVADERRAFRTRMDAAIREQEFSLHYQPIVSVADGRPWGAEALLRWNRDGELIPATSFISLTEETGQIRALGMESLSLLRADRSMLVASGLTDIVISFNLSVLQLEDSEFADLIRHWPTPGGLDGTMVEILESVFLPDRHEALAMVRRLAGIGAMVAVDDYGSGFSNPKLLQSLAPDYLKLDRSFLNPERDPEARRALISSVVVMASVIGAKVIAEGVETREDWDLVASVGVDLAQGYGVAPAMPVSDLIMWINDGSPRTYVAGPS